MQNKKLNGQEYILFSIPVDMLEEAGIGEESIIQIHAGKGQIIIGTANDIDDYVCDGACSECPVDRTDCDYECKSCPCRNHCEYCEVNEE